MEKDNLKSALIKRCDITIDDFPKSWEVRVLECNSEGYIFINKKRPEIVERNKLYYRGLRNLFNRLI